MKKRTLTLSKSFAAAVCAAMLFMMLPATAFAEPAGVAGSVGEGPNLSAISLTINGIPGGNATESGVGVARDSMDFDFNTVTIEDTMYVNGGNGGNGTQGYAGGAGGAVILNASTISVGNALTILSGAPGSNHPGGAGGAVSLQCTGTFTVPTINITKPTGGGAIDVFAGTLNVSADTTITVDGTAASEVVFDIVNIAAGQTLTIVSENGGKLTINNLNIADGGSVAGAVASIAPTAGLAASALPGGAVGTAYAQSIASNASGLLPFSFALYEASTLPAGLTLSAEGVISGTPTAVVYNHSFTVLVTDALGRTATQAFTLTVQNPPPVLETSITGLPQGYALGVGEQVSWTPKPTGGTWRYESEYLSITKDGNAYTFHALKTGTTKATYMADGATHTVTISITAITPPPTGGSGSFVPWLLLGAAALCGIGALVLRRKRKQK